MTNTVSADVRKTFQAKIRAFYRSNGRDMPWRHTTDAYQIMVSEIMLQQTQVARVIPKYEHFISKYPTIQSLAATNLGDVIRAWTGLGYNRRAKYLWQSAGMIVKNHAGIVPSDEDELIALPGIGVNTARAILTYAHQKRCPFIETNVRTVIIYFFFKDRSDVSDKEIMQILEQVTPQTKTNEFFWGVMDYGAYLKQSSNNISQSKQYKKQSTFNGSKRQIRGRVITLLTEGDRSLQQLTEEIPDRRLPTVLDDLIDERLIAYRNNTYLLF